MARHAGTTGNGADGALRWIGDLDHPFYDDERQRFLWYEASVIGFQLVLFLQLTVAPLVSLFASAESAALTALMTVPPLIAAVIVVAYAASKGAPFTGGMGELRRSRTYLLVVPMILVAIVVARFGAGSESTPLVGDGLSRPLVIGGVVAFVGGIVAGLRLANSGEIEDSAAAATPSTASVSTWDRFLRWAGDLDHPFYNEERQRFVWYEASAIGFQLILLMQLAAGGLILTIAGRTALLAVLVGIVPTLWATIAVTGYVQRRGARYFPKLADVRRSRGLLGLGVMVIYVAGMVRLAFDVPADASSFERGFSSAMPLGFAVGIAAAVVAAWLGNRKQLAVEAAEDEL